MIQKKRNSFLIGIQLFIFFGLLVLTNRSNAQVSGTGIFFQAVARDNYSNPAKDRTVYVESSIMQSTAKGTIVLTEMHKTTTDGTGVFSINVGNGTRIGGTVSGLNNIEWAKGPYYLGLKIAIQPLSPAQNWDYTKELVDLGASPFGTVPYALYSGSSGSQENKLSISDTAAMLSIYAKAQVVKNLANLVGVKISSTDTAAMLAPYRQVVDALVASNLTSLTAASVNSELESKVNLADSLTFYVTPTQLNAKTFDSTAIYNQLATKAITSDVNTALGLKASTASVTTSLATKEDLANKSINVITDAASDIKYPSVKAIKTYVDAQTVAASSGTLNFNTPLSQTGVNINISQANASTNGYISAVDYTSFINKIDATQKAANNGVATLGNDGKIPSNQIPAISFQSANVVSSQASMLALNTAVVGSIAIRTDVNKNFVLSATPASTLSNWLELSTPSSVTSVNGAAGPNVVLTTNDVTEGATNKYYTDARVRSAINANAPLSFNISTGTISMTAASNSANGYLSSTDFTIFNNKQNALTTGVDYLAPNGSAALLTNFPTLNQSTTGNAATATKLASIKNINGVAFDGSSNITIAADANTLTGTTLASTVTNSSLTSVGTITSGTWSGTAINFSKLNISKANITGLGIQETLTAAQAGVLSNTSGTNTGDQIIALTGDVTGSGNGSFVTTVNSVGGVNSFTIATLPTLIASNTASITANTNSINTLGSSVNTLTGNLTSTINNYLTTLPNLSQVGTINSGTWSGTVIGSNVGGAGSVNGILKANGNGVVSAAIAGTDFQTPITAAPTTGQFLTSAAAGTYTWTAASSVTGVPYTGATGSVNLGAYDLTVNGLTVGRGNGADATNTAIGAGALSSTTGLANTAIGASALGKATSPNSNTAIGSYALRDVTTGGSNTAIGSYASSKITTGIQNIAIGYSALDNVTANSNNTAIGFESIRYNSGTNNTALGANSLTGPSSPIASGSDNTAIGKDALKSANTAAKNTALGSGSLLNLTTGNENTAIGYNAGSLYGSGVGANLTNLRQGILIGGGARVLFNNSLNEIAIGYGTIGNGSNTVTVGNLSNTATYFTGDVNLTGNINGGTWSGTVIGSNKGGAGSVSGLMKANGSGVVSAAVAGTDFMAANATTTLTGDVEGSGNGSIATTVNSVGGVNSSTISGFDTRITSNTSSITTINSSLSAKADLASPTFTGTVSGISKSMIGLGNVENTALSTWTGSNNLSSVGAITSGTWSGTVIGNNVGGAGSVNGILKANGNGVVSAASAGTDFQTPITAAPANGQFLTSAAGGTYTWTAATSVTGVPYTGATGSVNLGSYDIYAKNAKFIGDIYTTPPSPPSASYAYDNTNYENNNGLVIHTYNQSGFPSLVSFVATGKINGNYRSNINFLTRPDGTTAVPLERLRITAEGRVGIGTTAPTTTLDVVGGGKISTDLFIGGAITSGTWSGTVIGSNYGGAGSVNGLLKANGSGMVSAAVAGTDYQVPLVAGTNYLVPNAAITAATKTKITYDAKGLVSSGADATTADIAPSTNRNYVTDVQAGVISNTSGVNTGDQTIALTGDVVGSGTGSFATTINSVGGLSSNTISTLPGLITSNTIDLTSKIDLSQKGANNGVATLGNNGKIPSSQIPAISFQSVNVVADETTMLGLSGAVAGSVAIRTDVSKNFVLSQTPASTLSNWVELATPNSVTTVNGYAGPNVSLTTSDVAASANNKYVTDIQSFTLSNTSGVNTGDQTITLTGDVTGTGTGSFATTINNVGGVGASTIATLPGLITTNTNNIAANTSLINGKVDLTQKGANNGVATLGNDGKIPSSQIPAISFQSVNVVADETTMLGLSGAVAGSVAIRTDVNKNFVLSQTPASTLSNWIELATPNSVTSVNGYAGPNVVLTTNDVATSANKNYVTDIQAGVISNTSGVNTGDQTITLTGDLTGSGTGSFATILSNSGVVSGTYGSATIIPTFSVNSKGRITSVTNTPLTAINSLGTFTTTSYAAGGTISGTILTLSAADATNPGLVSTGLQTIVGAKTFSSTSSANAGTGSNNLGSAKGLTVNPTLKSNGAWTELVAVDITPSFNFNGSANSAYPIGLRVQGANIVATGSGNDPSNTAIGVQSLRNNTTTSAGNNTAVGYNALTSTLTGTANTSIGTNTLLYSQSGSNNTAVGFNALTYNKANNNTAIGNYALYSAVSANDNIGIGKSAGSNYGSINSNAYTAASGEKNIFIGTDVRPLSNTDSYEIVIGSTSSGTGTIGDGTNTTTLGAPNTTSVKLYGATWRNNDAIARQYTEAKDLTIKGQDANVVGYGGGANNRGGHINLTPGQATGTEVGGNINLNVGSGTTSGTVNIKGQVKITGGNPGVGKVLTSNASGLASWATASSGVSTLTYTSASSNANGATISGTTLTLSAADATNPGLVSTGAQTFAGAKTFTNTVTFKNIAFSDFYNIPINGGFSGNSGQYNIGLGWSVLNNSNTGNNNIGLGYYALNANTSGTNNNAIGYNALALNTSGNNNVAMGYLAMNNNTDGDYNTSIGYTSLSANTTGNRNTVLGANALSLITSNGDNTAVGYYALHNNTAGFNDAFGSNSLGLNTSGTGNVAFGMNTISSNTTGNYNTAIGGGALGNSTTSPDNVAIGNSAGSSLTTDATNIGGSIFIGRDAGRQYGYSGAGGQHTTGYNNILIGKDARPLGNGDNNEIVISPFNPNNYYGGTSVLGLGGIGGGSNTTTIGNTSTTNAVIYGSASLSNYPATATLVGGATGANGADFVLKAQSATGAYGNGGNIVLTPGTAISGSNNGVVKVNGSVQITGGTPGLGKVLTSDASGVGTWIAPVGVSSLGAFSTTSNAKGGVINGTTLTLTAADETNPGLISTGAQTIVGSKTFSSTTTNFNGKIKIADGTQAVNRVLISDANGLASWANPLPSGQFGTLTDDGNAQTLTPNGSGTTSRTYLNSYITLPPGKWDVNCNILTDVSDGNATSGTWWVRLGFSTSSTSLENNNTDFPINTLVSGRVTAIAAAKYDMVKGHIIINNTSGSSKTYYLWADTCELIGANSGSANSLKKISKREFGENLIFALPMY